MTLRRREDLVWPVLGLAGLLVIVLGTFLPWLRSGQDTRNSYQAGGAVRRLIDGPGVVDNLLGLWPLVGLACALACAAYLLRMRTLAAVLAGLVATAAGAAAIGALAATANSYAHVAPVGPVVTLIGATLVALAVLLRAIAAVAVPRSYR